MTKLSTKDALKLAICTIEGLADQQACPDTWYQKSLDRIKEALQSLEKANASTDQKLADIVQNAQRIALSRILEGLKRDLLVAHGSFDANATYRIALKMECLEELRKELVND